MASSTSSWHDDNADDDDASHDDADDKDEGTGGGDGDEDDASIISIKPSLLLWARTGVPRLPEAPSWPRW